MDAVLDEQRTEGTPGCPVDMPPGGMESTGRRFLGLAGLLFLACFTVIGGGLPGRVGVNVSPIQRIAPWSAFPAETHSLAYDHLVTTIATMEYAITRLRAGEMPLWNPHQGLGEPLIGSSGFSPLSPAMWIHVFLPAEWSWTVWGALQLFIAGMGAWLLAGRHGLTGVARFIAGAIFMLAGVQVVWMHDPMAGATLWLPWVALAIERGIDRPTPPRVAVVALALAGQFFAGDAGASLGILLLGAAVYLHRLWRDPGVALKALPALLLALVIAAAMSSLHWWPWWQSLGGAAFAAAERGLPVPLLIARLVALGTAFVGVIAIPLAILGARRGWNHPSARQWSILTLALLAAAWGVTFAAMIADTSWWSGVFSGYALLAAPALGTALLAGFGLQTLIDDQNAAAHSPRSMRQIFVVTGIAAGALLLTVAIAITMAKAWEQPLFISATARLALTGAVLGAILLLARRRESSSVPPAWMAALVIVEMLLAAILLNPGSRRDAYFPPHPAIDFLLAQDNPGRFTAVSSVLPPNLATVYGLHDVRSHRRTKAGLKSEWIDLRYRLDPPGLSSAATQPAEVFSDDDIVVREFENVPPRAWIAPAAEVLPTRAEVRARLAVEEDFDPRETVLLDREIAPEIRRSFEDELERHPKYWEYRANGEAAAVYEPASPEAFQARCRGRGGWLVVANRHDPGWHAYHNHRQIPVVRAMGEFLAVRVPPGEAIIEFKYQPRAWRWGLYVSCGGTVLLLLVVGLGLTGKSAP